MMDVGNRQRRISCTEFFLIRVRLKSKLGESAGLAAEPFVRRAGALLFE